MATIVRIGPIQLVQLLSESNVQMPPDDASSISSTMARAKTILSEIKFRLFLDQKEPFLCQDKCSSGWFFWSECKLAAFFVCSLF